MTFWHDGGIFVIALGNQCVFILFAIWTLGWDEAARVSGAVTVFLLEAEGRFVLLCFPHIIPCRRRGGKKATCGEIKFHIVTKQKALNGAKSKSLSLNNTKCVSAWLKCSCCPNRNSCYSAYAALRAVVFSLQQVSLLQFTGRLYEHFLSE